MREFKTSPCCEAQIPQKQVQKGMGNLHTPVAEELKATGALEQGKEVASGSCLEIQKKKSILKHQVNVQNHTGLKGDLASQDSEAKRRQTSGPTDTPSAALGFDNTGSERSPPYHEEQNFQKQLRKRMGNLQASETEDPKAAVKRVYDQGDLLGEGGYGSTYEGFRKSDGLLVAIKYVSKSKAEMVMDTEGPIPVEVALLRRVNSAPSCPYIIRLIEWFDLPTEYALILERPHPCKDLLDVCISLGGRLSEELARSVMLHVVKALIHCQNRGVMHRDLKPENLLMTTTEIKLIDFGCGAFLKDTPFYQFFGTEFYCPPEVFLQRRYLAGPATVWSFGVTLYHLVSGQLPFKSREEIIKHSLVLPETSEVCKLLISWCLQPKPKNRPTLEQIQRHPWFH
ncbi:serine/threonine-protein kinase pim-1-like [Scleropages formosus]|uniref:serine/threonine-protein kinase pim-1-like n=1 Tax=Scleropages formosus TaxID=113540 RepID=UPI0010FA9BDB|nr:serine/threonine-protein kinase pim-1-like [Scleropages formosus]